MVNTYEFYSYGGLWMRMRQGKLGISLEEAERLLNVRMPQVETGGVHRDRGGQQVIPAIIIYPATVISIHSDERGIGIVHARGFRPIESSMQIDQIERAMNFEPEQLSEELMDQFRGAFSAAYFVEADRELLLRYGREREYREKVHAASEYAGFLTKYKGQELQKARQIAAAKFGLTLL